MTIEELEELISGVLPGAIVDFDNQHQIIIYTGLMLKDEEDKDSDLVDFDPDAVEDVDPDIADGGNSDDDNDDGLNANGVINIAE